MRCLVFFSGTGSTTEALLKYEPDAHYQIELLVTDNPLAGGISHARTFSKELLIMPRALADSSQQWCQLLLKRLSHYRFDLIILAGFMQILSEQFVDSHEGKIVNIHPSLLPEFKGLNTHQRALDGGRQEHGFSIHLVTRELDSGPILGQHRLRIDHRDTAESLKQRVQQNERYWYPRVIEWLALGKLSLNGKQVTMNGKILSESGLVL